MRKDRSESSTEITRTETRVLPVKLTDEELRERGDSLAAVIQNMNTEDRRQVDMKAQMKARLAELDAKKTQLAITISRREEERDVTVDVYHNYEALKVETVRRDTGETINRREMTQDELQRPLPV
jgi:hypothetical protein